VSKCVPENDSYRVHPRCPGEHWFTDQVTSNGPPRNVYDAPMVRHRWIYISGIVFWSLLVVSEIFLVIRQFRDHLPFDLSFWGSPFTVVLIATMLIRAGRLRRSAPPRRR